MNGLIVNIGKIHLSNGAEGKENRRNIVKTKDGKQWRVLIMDIWVH